MTRGSFALATETQPAYLASRRSRLADIPVIELRYASEGAVCSDEYPTQDTPTHTGRPEGYAALWGRFGCSSDGTLSERLCVRTNSREGDVLSLACGHAALPASHSIILNYSKRVSKGEQVAPNPAWIEPNCGAHRSSHVSWTFKLSSQGTGPKEFVKHVNWMTGNTMGEFQNGPCLDSLHAWDLGEGIKIFESLPPSLGAYMVPFVTELRTSPADAASRVLNLATSTAPNTVLGV
jgi:hypothetical protein